MSALTPSVRFQTDIPAVKGFDQDDETTSTDDVANNIVIESTSELMEHHFAGSAFGSTGAMKFLHDSLGQPLVFSVGTNKHLYVFAYVNGGTGGWTGFDITPDPSLEIQAYDAIKIQTSVIVVVAGKVGGALKIHQVSFPLPVLTTDWEGDIENPIFNKLVWSAIDHKFVNGDISTITCGKGKDKSSTDAKTTSFCVVAGVKATERMEASHYVYATADPHGGWSSKPLGRSAEMIRDCSPFSLPALLDDAYAMLIESEGKGEPVTMFIQGSGSDSRPELGKLTNPKSLTASITPAGHTDLLVAGSNGIAYINGESLKDVPTILVDGKSMTTVACSEAVVNEDKLTTIAVFGLSTHGDLYVCQGKRNADEDSIEWVDSGLPIRNGIRKIAGQVNPATGAIELVFATMNDELHLMARDPVTTTWKDTQMLVTIAGSKPPLTNAWAFVTILSLTDSRNQPIISGYPVCLTSEPTLAEINGMSQTLDWRPQTVFTDDMGMISIAIPMSDSLGACPIDVFLPLHLSERKSYRIQPAQRVIHQLSKFKTGQDIANILKPDGTRLFTVAQAQEKSEEFKKVAETLSQLPDLIARAGETSEGNPSNQEEETELIIPWQKSPEKAPISDIGILMDEIDAASVPIANALGDGIEYLKHAVKAKAAIYVKGASRVIHLLLEVAGGYIRIVCDTINSMIEGSARLLGAVLGIDPDDLLAIIGYKNKKIRETREELATILKKGIDLSRKFLETNRDSLGEVFDDYGKILEYFIDRDPKPPQHFTTLPNPFEGLLKNPIIQKLLKLNPVQWINELAEEESKDIEIPSIDFGMSDAIFKSLTEGLTRLMNFMVDLGSNVLDVINDISKIREKVLQTAKRAFWDLYATVKQIVLDAVDLIINCYDKFMAFLTEAWVIPHITNIWKQFAGCEFSIMNFVTYVIAELLEIFNTSNHNIFHDIELLQLLTNMEKKKMPSLLEPVQKNLKALQRELPGIMHAVNSSQVDIGTMVSPLPSALSAQETLVPEPAAVGLFKSGNSQDVELPVTARQTRAGISASFVGANQLSSDTKEAQDTSSIQPTLQTSNPPPASEEWRRKKAPENREAIKAVLIGARAAKVACNMALQAAEFALPPTENPEPDPNQIKHAVPRPPFQKIRPLLNRDIVRDGNFRLVYELDGRVSRHHYERIKARLVRERIEEAVAINNRSLEWWHGEVQQAVGNARKDWENRMLENSTKALNVRSLCVGLSLTKAIAHLVEALTILLGFDEECYPDENYSGAFVSLASSLIGLACHYIASNNKLHAVANSVICVGDIISAIVGLCYAPPNCHFVDAAAIQANIGGLIASICVVFDDPYLKAAGGAALGFEQVAIVGEVGSYYVEFDYKYPPPA